MKTKAIQLEKFQQLFCKESLFRSLIKARQQFGKDYTIFEDAEGKTLDYEALITRAFALGQKIQIQSEAREHIGILLPNSLAIVVLFFALQAYGRVPALLNFAAGSQLILNSCQSSSVRQIYSSKLFIKKAGLEHEILSLEQAGIGIIYLEDVAAKISLFDKIAAKLKSKLASYFYSPIEAMQRPDDEAVILFTSGSEGTPKGVALSHLNIQANRAQALAVIELSQDDILFNSLPLFHSFGLTAGTLLTLFSGVKTFLYPSPLHYQTIPSLIRQSRATLLFSTDTFLQGYARYAEAEDLESLKWVFAGAEKLKASTRELWNKKLGINILEGYGVTEASPILSLNLPDAQKAGSVGRLLPGIDYQLSSIPGIEGGRLSIKGPNVLLGLYHHHNAGTLELTADYHDTGDIVAIDPEGFVTILGRAKRFAKIAGEMVSLQAVEQFISEVWPEAHHAVLSCAHPKHGEMLVLITDYPDAHREDLVEYAHTHGLTNLMCPKKVIILPNLPLLATGKINYEALKNTLESMQETSW